MNQSQVALKGELFLYFNAVNVFLTQLQGLTILIRKFKESQKLVAFYLSSKKSNLRKKKEAKEKVTKSKIFLGYEWTN